MIGVIYASDTDNAIYARVSTDDQEPENQLIALRDYCRYRGWQGVREYVDHGVSGMKESRPAWDQVWHMIQTRKIKVLVVQALDRIGRSMSHLVQIMDTMIKNGIVLVSVRENIDLSTPAGLLLARIIASMAEYERSILVERTKAGHRRARAEGKLLGAANPKCRNLTMEARRRGAKRAGEVATRKAAERAALRQAVAG